MKMFNFFLLLVFSMTLSVNSLQAQTPAPCCKKGETKTSCTKASAEKSDVKKISVAKKTVKATSSCTKAKSTCSTGKVTKATSAKCCKGGTKATATTASQKTVSADGKSAACSKGAAKSTASTVSAKTVSTKTASCNVKSCDPVAKTCNGIPCPAKCCEGGTKAKATSVALKKKM